VDRVENLHTLALALDKTYDDLQLEDLNPKLEYRKSKQIRIVNLQMFKTTMRLVITCSNYTLT